MSLGDCLTKAGKAFDSFERDELLTRAGELAAGGKMPREDAEIAAVKERLEEVQEERKRIMAIATKALKAKSKGVLASRVAPPVERMKPATGGVLARLWYSLAKADGMFRYGWSNAADLATVVKDVAGDEVRLSVGPRRAVLGGEAGEELYRITPAQADEDILVMGTAEAFVHVFPEDGRIELDVSRWEHEEGGGALYSALANWAYNNSYIFAGDREGISATGMRRRLEHMISAALKAGTTAHIEPHPKMLESFDMDWKAGDDAYNVEQMLETSARILRYGHKDDTSRRGRVDGLEELDNIDYNEQLGVFWNREDDQEFTTADFAALAGRAPARAIDAGGTTLKRAVLTRAISARGDTGGAQQRFLEQLREYTAAPQVSEVGGLRKLLSSKRAEAKQKADEETAAREAAEKAEAEKIERARVRVLTAKAARLIASNELTNDAYEAGSLKVMTLAEARATLTGPQWASYFESLPSGVRGAYNPATEEAVVFIDQFDESTLDDVVPVAIHELLHEAQDYAERTGSERLAFLVGAQREALHKRLELLRTHGSQRERDILDAAHDMFTSSNPADEEVSQLEWMAYAAQEITKAKAAEGKLRQWLDAFRQAVLDTIRKVLRVDIGNDALSLNEFSRLVNEAIRLRNSMQGYAEASSGDTAAEVLSSAAPLPLNKNQVEAVEWALDAMPDYWADANADGPQEAADLGEPIPASWTMPRIENGRLVPSDWAVINEDLALRLEEDFTYRIEDGVRDGASDGGLTPAQGRAKKRDVTSLTAAIRGAAKNVLSSNSAPGQAQPRQQGGTVNTLNAAQKAVAKLPHLLGLLPRRALAEVAPPQLTAVQDFVRDAEQMDADRNQLLSETGQLLESWHTWAREHQSMAHDLHKLMHQATVAGVDPSETYAPLITGADYLKERTRLLAKQSAASTPEARLLAADLLRELENRKAEEAARRTAAPGLTREWNKLSPEAKRLYKEVRDTYGKQREMLLKELQERVERTDATQEVRTQLADKLRLTFEATQTRGPYFPLARFGSYWGVAKNANGTTVEYRMFEDMKERAKWAKDMQAAGNDVRVGKRLDDNNEYGEVDPKFAATVTALVGEATGVAYQQRVELADQIWQLYLQTLPDMNVRKQFIHRKKTAGWDEDALRAYGKLALHHAHHITKIRHGDKLAAHVNRAAAQAKSMTDSTYADVVVSELRKAQAWAMNPTSHPAAQMLNSIGFLWYLSVSPAAAMVNMVQTPMVGIPVLGGKFGVANASAELWRAAKEFTGVAGANLAKRASTGRVFLDTAEKEHYGDRLQGEEKAAYEELIRRGRFDKTLAHDTAGIADEGLDRNMKVRMWMDRVAASFHNAEQFNREVTGIAAYRLARKARMTHEQAVDYASEAIQDIHFDYSNANRARVLRHPVAKVIGQFKQYAVNMTWRVLRDIYVATAAPDIDPAMRKEVRKRATVMTIMSLSFGGVSGFVGYSLIKFMADLLMDALGDDDKPEDAEAWARSALAEMLGEDMADFIWKGPVDYVTGASVGSRVSPDIWKLWFQEDSRGYEGRDQWLFVLQQVMGPVVGGLGAAIGDGIDKGVDGEYRKAFEQMIPKAARDISKALRFSQEGVTTLRGDPIVGKDALSYWDIALQAAGFTPAEVDDQYSLNRQRKKRERDIGERRDRILNKVYQSVENDEGVTPQLALMIEGFNTANPDWPITGLSIQSGLKGRGKASQKMVEGVYLNPKLRDRITSDVAF